LAVEVLETLSHSAILEKVWATGVLAYVQTLEKIRTGIVSVPDEDEIAVIDRTGTTASELSIDLTRANIAPDEEPYLSSQTQSGYLHLTVLDHYFNS
jgi:hypothetical protein